VEKNNVEELVEAAKRGASESLAELCEMFHPEVYRYMLRRAPREEAEELANEVCLRAVKALPRQRGFFQAWLYRIAANLLIDWHRRRSVRSEFFLDGVESSGNSDSGSFSRGVDLRIELEKAMADLNDEQRDLLSLRFVEGYTAVEVAEILEKSPEAVRAQQFRALKVLRNRFADQGARQ